MFKLKNTVHNFEAGKTGLYSEEWEKLTSDKWILATVTGHHVEINKTPVQHRIPNQLKFSADENVKIEKELERFLKYKVIETVQDIQAKGEFISNIFTRPKKDNKIRNILNLKQFNDYIEPVHFKMETLQFAINSMRKICYFGSVDLSESYYSLPITEKHRKFFRLWYNGQKYQFTCLVMGLATASRVFTKVLKPVFASLREKGYISTSYIDDSCLQGQTYAECEENVWETFRLMDNLGLTINPEKSVLIPSKQIVFVGFILCSETMTVRPTKKKKLTTSQIYV